MIASIFFMNNPSGGKHAVELTPNARQAWAEGSCQAQRVIVAGDRIIQFVDVHVRLKHETEWREGQVAEVYTFRDGKVIQVRIFADSRQALESAGLKIADAS